MNLGDDPTSLQILLTELRVEHQDLDATIARLESPPPGNASKGGNEPPIDELMLRRMKKRKLQIKDKIAAVERMLGPDLLA